MSKNRYFKTIRQPIGGFKTTGEACRYYSGQGKTNDEIAKFLQIPHKQVEHALIAKLHTRYQYISMQATKRDMTFEQLLDDMLYLINRDQMVDAIMDDE